ncbi:MAG TPA: UDP-glucose/GDP-mannose dehydrogenase family protein [Dehalococcoidia bacterium]|nr:UDP-glucose/GDP-mannose dehydrogenase family protein [Dehalococcoidia bacterium]
MTRICVIGAGYVGLVTGACLAERGHDVVCLDTDTAKVQQLRAGDSPFYEPGLDELLVQVRSSGRIRFTHNYADAIPGAEAVFIAVNTPSSAEGQADLMAVRAAARDLGPLLSADTVIVNKSTVPIGTGDLVAFLIAQCTRVPFSVVSNPEFLREGSAVHDFRHPDRLVLGSRDPEAARRVAALYGPLDCPILITDIRTAEMIKYASNAYLATRISFINEIAAVCERLGADVTEVARGMGYDQRIGPQFLNAGIGWGGSCFPKDVRALIHMAAASGSHPQLLRAVVEINHDQRLGVIQKLKHYLGSLEGRTITLLGLSFKPNTDDLRNAPSVDLIELLRQEGCHIRAYDPVALERARRELPDIELCADAYAGARDADALVLVTEWEEFRRLNFGTLRRLMRSPLVIDGRNLFEPTVMRQSGFTYAGIGRPAALAVEERADEFAYGGRPNASEPTFASMPA